ncbi:MAG: hypothetical protein A3K19_22140 [Lentisphaerae bacterium RIFOXYB12_FULL_65_16]|nr:MAG: hypothetical protein A3K18_21430 [Lentisphaerae bacterium RIFOXYA12_64_32]OGV93562.1 MAG: hypothetical protein A3K19_22140 [Lentisphaerae bacterium RIFOXYB12_FULL_65_16]
MNAQKMTVKIDIEETVDVLVIGGGVAAVCAAIAAGRNGCETALVEMDMCLGGNSGPLLGVHVSGAHSFHPYASETGIIEELELEAARQAAKTITLGHHYNISHQWDLVLEQGLRDAGVRVYRQHQARRALTEGRRVVGVIVEDIQHFRTKLFRVRHGIIDASGDGVVAVDAGASFMRGTESKARFGERSGPEKDSAITMGTSITALVRKASHPVDFVMPPEFAARATAEGPPTKTPGYRPAAWRPDAEFCFIWATESGGQRDTILDDAEIRQEILYQFYRCWDNVKNHSCVEEARNWELAWVSPKSGKRESHRFIGDYVLTQTDVEAARAFPDSIGYGGYFVDVHEPVGLRSKVVCYSNPPLWNFPYRSCYSKDFDNLWLAGRLMSVSHLALGTVRLMRTLGCIGQGVGTAVGLAKQLGCTAREVYEKHIETLQQTLLRQDATILTTANHDPADIARTATVTATSEMRHGVTRVSGGYLPLDVPRGVQLWDWAPELRGAEFAVRNTTTEPQKLRLRLELFERKQLWKDENERIGFKHITGPANRMEWGSDSTAAKFAPVAECEAVVPPGFDGWVTFRFTRPVPMIPADPTSDENRYNLLIEPAPGVELGVDAHAYDFALRLWRSAGEATYSVAGDCHAFRLSPAPRYGEAVNVINGHNRRYSTNPVNAWLSDFDAPLPQSITLEFPEPCDVARVHLTFDTIERCYHEAPINCNERAARRCVADYRVEVRTGAGWEEVVAESDNRQRWRVHRFAARRAEALRLTVLRVHDPRHRARVYEIRAYGPNAAD